LYVDGTNGLILNIRTGGGILIDPQTASVYDQNIVGIEDIEDFSFTTTDDHIYHCLQVSLILLPQVSHLFL
jgi:hypothetical protein